MATTSTPQPVVANELEQSPTIRFDDVVERVLAHGRINLRKELERLRSLGVIDEHGVRLKSELPADMQPGADRDFGG